MAEQIERVSRGKLELVADCVSAEDALRKLVALSVVRSGGAVAMLLLVKAEGSVAGQEGGGMWMELPPDYNTFAKSARLIGVRTLLHPKVVIGCVLLC
ncbi:hypothetical protein HYDPIDRAFT_109513 [Hydnomerulius pinastri MD-312]|nr:hypothetical protein HYDPIDRAFT_109513 [Hydnomerulius pinastri MD-312]